MKLAIVLFNLGGPDAPESVQPFLFNLFNDPAIISLPGPLRWLVAKFISGRRAPVAREIYAHLGGRSPLLENTRAQADALAAGLSEMGEVKTFIAMRYWHPRAAETVRAVKEFAPDQVLLLPLYPQYSTTTTGSSLKEWQGHAAAQGLTAPVRSVCCWPAEQGLIEALAGLVRSGLEEASAHGTPRLLLSAHGLPKKIVQGGDPYQAQVERTAAALIERLAMPGLDWNVCYQSRVGPLEWIGPSTDAEIARAGADKVPVVICPIAFVSEHSETLVEIEIEYRHAAQAAGVPAFVRVPAVGTDPAFIGGLAETVRRAMTRPEAGSKPDAGWQCPSGFARCGRT